MKPAPFRYLRPTSVEEALGMLADPGAKVLAGGQSLVPLLSMRLAEPAALVDVNWLPDAAALRLDAAALRVGCLTRHRAVERHGGHSAVLAEALAQLAHPAIRNRGTVVGSLAHADPAAELPAVLRLLDGSVEAVSAARGRRVIPAAAFVLGPLESALAPDELAVAATVPRPPPGAGTAWREVSRRRGDYALVGVGALVAADATGVVDRAVVCLTGVGGAPVLVDVSADLASEWVGSLPAALAGGDLAASVVARVGGAVEPEADIHASAAYRAELAGVLTRRALAAAAADAVARRSGADAAGGADG